MVYKEKINRFFIFTFCDGKIIRLHVEQSHQTLNAELLSKIKLQAKKNSINRKKHLTFYQDFIFQIFQCKILKGIAVHKQWSLIIFPLLISVEIFLDKSFVRNLCWSHVRMWEEDRGEPVPCWYSPLPEWKRFCTSVLISSQYFMVT